MVKQNTKVMTEETKRRAVLKGFSVLWLVAGLWVEFFSLLEHELFQDKD